MKFLSLHRFSRRLQPTVASIAWTMSSFSWSLTHESLIIICQQSLQTIIFLCSAYCAHYPGSLHKEFYYLETTLSRQNIFLYCRSPGYSEIDLMVGHKGCNILIRASSLKILFLPFSIWEKRYAWWSLFQFNNTSNDIVLWHVRDFNVLDFTMRNYSTLQTPPLVPRLQVIKRKSPGHLQVKQYILQNLSMNSVLLVGIISWYEDYQKREFIQATSIRHRCWVRNQLQSKNPL